MEKKMLLVEPCQVTEGAIHLLKCTWQVIDSDEAAKTPRTDRRWSKGSPVSGKESRFRLELTPLSDAADRDGRMSIAIRAQESPKGACKVTAKLSVVVNGQRLSALKELEGGLDWPRFSVRPGIRYTEALNALLEDLSQGSFCTEERLRRHAQRLYQGSMDSMEDTADEGIAGDEWEDLE